MSDNAVRERELVLTRIYDVPRELVYKAWTDPEHVKRWWGPDYFSCPTCEMDVRPGGKLLIVMEGQNGELYPMPGEFLTVEPNVTVSFSFKAGHDASCSDLEGVTSVVLSDEGGKTKMVLTTKVIGLTDVSEFMIQGMEPGWTQSLGKLESALAAL